MKRIMFRASLLIIALMISLPAWAGTFKDDFNDGNFDGWEIENCRVPGSEWKVDNGALTCRCPLIWSTALISGEKEWRNYSIECDAKMVQILSDFKSIALDLRCSVFGSPCINWNTVWCNVGAWQGEAWSAGIEVWFNNAGGKKSRKNFNFELNRWYRLKGVANDNNFESYIDGELMASISDSTLPTGRLGLSVYGCVAHFDNVVITGDDVPDNTTAVSCQGKLATSWGRIRSQ